MDTLIGALTALIGLLILAVAFGALALVTTGAAVPWLAQRRSRRRTASTTVSSAHLPAHLGDLTETNSSTEPVTTGTNQEHDAGTAALGPVDDGGRSDGDDTDQRRSVREETSPKHP